MAQISASPREVIAARVKALRQKRGWSTAHLATELAKVGISWDRSIIAKIETGTRASLDVVELLALAYVLGVSPLHLLLPPPSDPITFYDVTPGTGTTIGEVLDWLRAEDKEHYLKGQHSGWFAEEVREYGER